RGPSNSLRTFSPHPVTFSPTPRPRKSFSGNTYGSPRKCCKQKTYGIPKSFSCNTYKKQGVGGVVVNQTSGERCLSRATIGSEGPLLLIRKKASFTELLCFQAFMYSFPQRQLLRCF